MKTTLVVCKIYVLIVVKYISKRQSRISENYENSRMEIYRFLALELCSYTIIRVYFLGGSIFFIFMSPYLPFYFIFIKEFSKFGVLYPTIFFEKFPKMPRKFLEIFSTFSKLIKHYYF